MHSICEVTLNFKHGFIWEIPEVYVIFPLLTMFLKYFQERSVFFISPCILTPRFERRQEVLEWVIWIPLKLSLEETSLHVNLVQHLCLDVLLNFEEVPAVHF